MNRLYVVGIGPGNKAGMTLEAWDVLASCEVIVGYTVYVELVKKMMDADQAEGIEFVSTPMMQETKRVQMALSIAAEGRKTALVGSGDATVYGLAGLAMELNHGDPDMEIEVIAGVTAALSGSARLGAMVGHDFATVSLSDLLTPWTTIEKRLKGAAYADLVICLYNPSSKKRKDHLKRACEIVLCYRRPDTVCGIVTNIGREGETTKILTLKELMDAEVDMFTTVFIGNSETKEIKGKAVTPRGYGQEKPMCQALETECFYEDEAFLRNDQKHVPMTKYPIRVLALNELKLSPDSIAYDIGAGTGSVTIEMARKAFAGRVYAIEKKEEAVSILRENIQKFAVSNVEVVEGKAPQALTDLPAPDCVFIGGSSGELKSIIDVVREKNPGTLFVVTAVTLETMALLLEISKEYEDYQDMKILEVLANRSELLAGYHMMRGGNPIYIATFGGKLKNP